MYLIPQNVIIQNNKIVDSQWLSVISSLGTITISGRQKVASVISFLHYFIKVDDTTSQSKQLPLLIKLLIIKSVTKDEIILIYLNIVLARLPYLLKYIRTDNFSLMSAFLGFGSIVYSRSIIYKRQTFLKIVVNVISIYRPGNGYL